MPALFPMMVAPESFRPGDCVKKFVTDRNLAPFVGVVTHIVPATSKIWVQWPTEHCQESPEYIVRVNPNIHGLPSAMVDQGYSSFEKSVSERLYGVVPKRAGSKDQMAIRIAHTFAEKVIGRLVDDIVVAKDSGRSDVQAYNDVFPKFSNICSDHIIRSSIKKIYSGE